MQDHGILQAVPFCGRGGYHRPPAVMVRKCPGTDPDGTRVAGCQLRVPGHRRVPFPGASGPIFQFSRFRFHA